VSALLLDVRVGHDLSGEVKPFAEVIKTLRSEGIVVVLPRETSLYEAAGSKRLAYFALIPRVASGVTESLTSLDDVKVLGINIAMLGEVEVLFRNEYALCGDRVSAYPCMQHEATNLYVVP
jgi:hypothetical protein